jgi:uncharacterized membrane protein YbhN (UPF0104 family)
MPSWRTWAKIAVTAFVLWLLLRHIDLVNVRTTLAQAEPSFLVAALLLQFLVILGESQRWRRVMEGFGEGLSIRSSIAYTLVAGFFGNALPSTIGGDAYRIWQIKQLGTPLGLAARITITDRLLAFTSLLLLIVLALPRLLDLVDDRIARWTVIGIVVSCLAALLMLMAASLFDRRFAKSRFANRLFTLSRDFDRMMTLRVATIAILGWALCAQFGRIAVAVALCWGLGIDISAFDVVALVPISLLIAMVPVSMGGWGIREAVFVSAFAYVDVPAAAALVVSVLFGLVRLVAGLIGGAVWLGIRRDSPSPARSATDPSTPA